MSLAARLTDERPTFKPRFVDWIETLNDEDHDALVAAAKDPAWTNAALARTIASEGFEVHKDTLKEWRARVTR